MVNIVKTKGIILKTIPFKESSLFISILTKKYGKIKVLAKGCRRPKSKLCGTMELFNLDEIIFYKRESKEVYTLSDAVILDDFEKLRAQPNGVNAAMVLCEFYEKTLPVEERNNESFILLLNFLKAVQKSDESSIKPTTLYYLLIALTGAGVRPHLDNCVRCHKPIKLDNKKIDFSIGAGGVVCNEHYDDTVIFLSDKTFTILKQVYSNKNIEIDNNSIGEIETFIPDYLYYHLNNLILHSLKYLK